MHLFISNFSSKPPRGRAILFSKIADCVDKGQLNLTEAGFEKAVEHAEIALGRAPEGPQMDNLKAQIERLKKGENINP